MDFSSHPAAQGSIPEIFSEANQWRWLEESGQWPEKFNGAHLVLASGKLVLPKLGFARHLSLYIGFEPKYNSPALLIAPIDESF